MERYPSIIEPYSKPVKRYCQALDLVDDAELIRQYRLLHSPEKHFDWDGSFERLSKLPRQAEREGVVAKLQGCRSGAKSD